MSADNRGALAPETHHIDVIPDADRHGRPRDLFFLWFASNVNIGSAVFGAVAVALGNNLVWAIVAVLVGNTLGAAFMASHSAQGPVLGVPQLIQSRGQFGYLGALLPVVLAAVLYCGFFILTAIIAAQAVTGVVPGLGMTPAIVICCLVSLLLALFGNGLIHKAARWATWPLIICAVIVTIGAIGHGGLHATASGFHVGPFALAVALLTTFTGTYAPYVSDYSRYLPSSVSASGTFWATFLGVGLSVVWTQLIGVVLAIQYTKLDSLHAADQVVGAGALGTTILIITAISIGGQNAMNLYSGQLNLVTAISSIRRVPTGLAVRALLVLPTFAIGLYLAIAASSNFINTVNNLLSVLQILFIPWGAINLTDFYLVKHGRYDVESFFRLRGAYYANRESWTVKGFALKALLCYAVGVLASLPFVNDAWIHGFFVDSLGGGDYSIIPGFVVPAVLYYALMRPRGARSAAGARASRSDAPFPADRALT